MQTLVQDLRYGLRMLRRNLGFTAVAVLTLALGIGVNTAIFSVVNGALIKWLQAFNASDRLVMVWQTKEGNPWPSSPADFRDWRDQNHVFEQMGAYYYESFNLSGRGEPERILGAFVSAGFFRVLGVEALHGRSFLLKEEQWGDHRVVLLSHGLWTRRFGSDPAVVGQVLTLNGEPYTVVGVMPPGAWFANTRAELWTPMAFAPGHPWNTRHSHFLNVVARLKSGVALTQANVEMETIARRIEQQYPENVSFGARVMPLREAILGNIEPTLFVLWATVGFVLLIACANVANLLLARAAGREREVAVRAALGASRGRLVRQLLTESVLLALLGGGLGLLLAFWGVDLVVGLIPSGVPRVHEIGIRIDGRVLGLTFALALLTGMVFGLAPALQASRPDLRESLKEGGRGAGQGRRGRRVRSLLVVCEVALALVLLIGAGLMIRSFASLEQVKIGVRTENLLTMHIALRQSESLDPQRVAAFYQQVFERVQALPGVLAAGVTSHVPLGGGGQAKHFTIEGRAAPAKFEEVPIVSTRQESANSLAAMGIPLLRGRYFSERDTSESPHVAIINETIARRFFSNEDSIGKIISLGPPEHLWPAARLPRGGRFARWTVVGVVGDVKYGDLRAPAEPIVYVPYVQRNEEMGWSPTFLVVHTQGDPLRFVPAVREQVWAVDKNQPVADVRTIEQHIQTSLRQPRFTMLLLGVFAALALVLAAVGIYGVISYSVTQRTHEIGIRMALGAQAGDVLKFILVQGMIPASTGVAVGLAAAFALTRLMSSLLYGVSATDPATFVVVSLLLAAVALVACYIPARRATKVDPMVALRYE